VGRGRAGERAEVERVSGQRCSGCVGRSAVDEWAEVERVSGQR
jgi:hypothetical protein